jgi:acetyl esterase/lipase
MSWEDIRTVRLKMRLLSSPLIGAKSKKIIIANRFRAQAKQIVKEFFIKTYGLEFWYDEDVMDWSKSGKLRTEWVIPNKLTLSNNNPVLLYIHGGGYIAGTFSNMRPVATKIAIDSNCLALGVDYRLAPEYTIQCMIEDVLATYFYLISKDADGFGMDPSQIAVGGESAGGGLASVFGHFIRDSGLPLPCGLVLLSPYVDVTHSQPSMINNAEYDYLPLMNKHMPGKRPNLKEHDCVWQKGYCHPSPKVRGPFLARGYPLCPYKFINSPMVSPMCDNKFTGLPPVLVEVGDVEVFRDEGIVYGQLIMNSYKLSDLQNKVIINVYEEMPHAWQHLLVFHDQTQRSIVNISEFLKVVFSKNSNVKFESGSNFIKVNGNLEPYKFDLNYDNIPSWKKICY